MLDASFWWLVLAAQLCWWAFLFIYAWLEIRKLRAAIGEIAISYP